MVERYKYKCIDAYEEPENPMEGCRVHDAASGLWSGSSITGDSRRAGAEQTVIVIGACERKVLCRS